MYLDPQISKSAADAVQSTGQVNPGVLGLLIVLIIDRFIQLVYKLFQIVSRKNGKSGGSDQVKSQCKDDPRFQTHVTEAHDSLIIMQDLKPILTEIRDANIASAELLKQNNRLLNLIVQNGKKK